MERERIISVDSHANIPEERVLEQLPERFRGEYVEAKEAALQRDLTPSYRSGMYIRIDMRGSGQKRALATR